MSDSPAHAARPAACSVPAPRAALGPMAVRLIAIIEEQLDWLELTDQPESFSESHVCAVISLIKAIQGLDDLLGRFDDNEEINAPQPSEIMEFRYRLAQRIAAIGQPGEADGLAGGSAPA